MGQGQTRRGFLAGAAAGAVGTAVASGSARAAANLPSRAGSRLGLLGHRFGVNYVPSGNWYFSYNDWNRRAVDRDLGRVAELGADHIRFMVVWPWFQPNPRVVSEAHLDRLDDLVELGARHGLDVVPSIFTGWLSGFHFNPNFYDQEPFYASPKWREAQELYLDVVSARLRRHPNLLGVDLGNELACNWKAPTREGDAWSAAMLGRLERLLPGGAHVNGVDHTSWFSDDTFSARALVMQQRIVSLHCWPFWTGAGRLGGPLDKPYTHLIAGMAALARSLGGVPDKPIWAQEFGACTLEMPEEALLRYADLAIDAGIEAGVSWFTWWSSHDVSRRFDFHPFEYGLGLIDENNVIKPLGRRFREIADRYRSRPVVIPAAPPPPPMVRSNVETWRWLTKVLAYEPPAGWEQRLVAPA